jgi:hypothetical protein
MTYKAGDKKIDGKVTLGPPILLIEGADAKETTPKPIAPEKLKAFQDALTRLFDMESSLLSADDLKSKAAASRGCLCCGTHDQTTMSSHWDDVVMAQ